MVAALAGAALLAPGAAAAATVVNGDFEAGNLSGWGVHRVMEVGNWFAYKGTSDPIAKQRSGPNQQLAQAPPQGTYAAISDELQADTLTLSQEVALEPGSRHRLSLLAYYDSVAPLAVPSPDTLAVSDEQLGGQANQQFRIDVMRAGSPLESLDPADILRTVFRAGAGDPTSMGPTWLSADLTPFAGQTVRLRIVNAVHEDLFTAGVDAVSIESAKPGQALPPLGSNKFSFGKLTRNRANGTATLVVDVPGAGTLSAKGEGRLPAATAGASKAGKKRALIKPVTASPKGAGKVTLRLRPTAPARAVLKREYKLRVPIEVTFAPAGGEPRTATLPVVLRLAPPPQRGR